MSEVDWIPPYDTDAPLGSRFPANFYADLEAAGLGGGGGSGGGNYGGADAVDSQGFFINSPYELVHDFAGDANGAPVTAESGQTWVKSYNRIAGSPTVVSGVMTNTDTASGVSASYLSATLGGPVTFLSADFAFGTTGATDGQNAVLAAWATALPSGAIGAIPDSPCHCVFTRVSVHYGVWDGSGLDYLGEYIYPVQPGSEVQHAEITLDRDNGVAHVLCPDGERISFADPRVGSIDAPYVTAEIYYPAADTARRVNFSTFAADSAILHPTPSVQAAIGVAQSGRYVTKTASYTASVEDDGRGVLFNSSSAVNYTVPPNATVGLPVGALLSGTQWGTGQVTFVQGSGVVLRTATSLKTRAQYATLTAEQVSIDNWLISGDAE